MTLDSTASESEINDPNFKKAKLEEIRRLVKQDESLEKPIDDEILQRFLLAKAYHLNAAFAMLKGYHEYKKRYTDSWLTVDRTNLRMLLECDMVTFLNGCNTKGQRIFWLRIGKWNPREFSPDLALQASGVIAECALQDPTTPMTGIQCIFDMKNLGFTHVKGITPSFAKQMVSFMANCLPMHINAIHIIREPTIFSVIFTIYKAFLDERMKKRIMFHGNDLSSLHKQIHRSLLPAELGGDAADVPAIRWLELIDDELSQKGLAKAGYRFSN